LDFCSKGGCGAILHVEALGADNSDIWLREGKFIWLASLTDPCKPRTDTVGWLLTPGFHAADGG